MFGFKFKIKAISPVMILPFITIPTCKLQAFGFASTHPTQNMKTTKTRSYFATLMMEATFTWTQAEYLSPALKKEPPDFF